jgi:hypothetical protein
MNAMNQALNVYNNAKAAVKAGKSTVQDEVVIALWEITQEQEATITAQSYTISVLESRDSDDTASDNTEATAFLNKIRYNVH